MLARLLLACGRLQMTLLLVLHPQPRMACARGLSISEPREPLDWLLHVIDLKVVANYLYPKRDLGVETSPAVGNR